jgi:hypothetical protein
MSVTTAGLDDTGERLEVRSAAIEKMPHAPASQIAADPEVDGLRSQLERLIGILRSREHASDYDAVDQVAVRLALHTLSTIGLNLHHHLASSEASLRTARVALRDAERLAAAEQSRAALRSTAKPAPPQTEPSAPDALPKAATPRG